MVAIQTGRGVDIIEEFHDKVPQVGIHVWEHCIFRGSPQAAAMFPVSALPDVIEALQIALRDWESRK